MKSQDAAPDPNFVVVTNALNGAISPFCVSGDIPFGNDRLTLHFSPDEDNANLKAVRFPLVDSDAITPLIEACKQARFGIGQQSVLDPEYRRALVLHGSQFAVAPATSLDPSVLGILADVRRALLGDPAAHIVARLDKLNVYGVGDFFKGHVDTPSSNRMFGTLLINLPVEHQGGNLVVYAPNNRGSGEELEEGEQTDVGEAPGHRNSFTTNWGDVNTLGWIAFFSDCPHEVLPVTQGNRVTLTFNLYFEGHDGDNGADESDPVLPRPQFAEPAVDRLVEALKLPGQFDESRPRLCFHLQHRYPVDLNKDRADIARQFLKGADAVIYRAMQKLGATVSFHFVTPETGYDVQWRKNRDLGHYILDEAALVKLSHTYTFLISHTFSGVPIHDVPAVTLVPLPELETKHGKKASPSVTGTKFTYIAHGNEPCVTIQYASICMIACIPGHDIKDVWPKSDYNPRKDYW